MWWGRGSAVLSHGIERGGRRWFGDGGRRREKWPAMEAAERGWEGGGALGLGYERT